MKKRQLSYSGFLWLSVCMIIITFSGCGLFEKEEKPYDDEPPVLIDLGSGGATPLLALDGNILIGFNSYAGTGSLASYDPETGLVSSTGVVGTDIAAMAYHAGSKRIYVTGSTTGTAYIDTSLPENGWSAVPVTGGGAPGADLALHGDKVYVVNTTWMEPIENTLFIIDAVTGIITSTVDLNDGAPTDRDGLSKIGVDPASGFLYITDTSDGDIFTCGPDGSNIVFLTTTAAGSTGDIYFDGGYAYVLVGLTSSGSMGVHRFDPESPAAVTSHFSQSASISAQYMAFADEHMAYVTHYNGGVYSFDPSTPDSGFTILKGTVPLTATGLQDIILENGILYVTINNYMKNSYLMLADQSR
ncbi:MAG: hypothetical protein JW881_11820 [Spirochaetales bacterium]|nr:hypothetical protein [Spirochaetales bacterium]